MARDPSKTEKATPRRRQKAREEGQVLKSQDVPIAFSLVVISAFLYFYLPYAYHKLLAVFAYAFSYSIEDGVQYLVYTLSYLFILLVAPVFFVLLVSGVAGNVVQFGFLFSLKPLVPKLDNVNPVKGLQRLFSLKTVFETFKNTLKLAVAFVIGYLLAKHILSGFSSFGFLTLQQQAFLMVKFAIVAFLVFGLLSVPIAAVDFFYRRWEYEENLKMSKEEVKEERKQYEGHPIVKSAIRKKQREIAFKRMMARVPEADVVITNPTHYAVALKYERGKMNAPQVIAKGVDNVALKIKEIAQEHGIPIEENPELARALYESCEVGDFIPEEFYRAVAKVLAKIYRRKKLL